MAPTSARATARRGAHRATTASWHNGGMARSAVERRWYSANQPQTLRIAVILLYWNAAIDLLFGIISGGAGLFLLLFVAANALGAFGVANERKWGYFVALLAAFAPFILLAVAGGGLFAGGIFGLIFEIALVVLLLHPMSRSYFRLWFR